MIPTLAVIFLSLVVQFCNDRAIINKYREQGIIPPEDTMRDELTVSTFEVGINELNLSDELSFKLMRCRQISDIMNNSVRDLYDIDQEVKAWADKLGGLQKVQAALVRDQLPHYRLGKKSWYMKTLKELRDLGYDIQNNLDLNLLPAGDTATNYSPYAMDVHRSKLVQKWHGELDEDQDELTTPNWALSESDFDIEQASGSRAYRKDAVSTFYTSKDKPTKDKVKASPGDGAPYWWEYISMGKFRAGVREPSKNLTQIPTSRMPWIPDIRLSVADANGGWVEKPFQQITKVTRKDGRDPLPWSIMSDNESVKELTHRFYNEPRRLHWQRIGFGEKTRWAVGMLVPSGKWLWVPLSYPSSDKVDWYKENEGKKYTPKLKRALYFKEWIITYKKVWNTDNIRVVKMKQHDGSGMREGYGQFEVWVDKLMHWKDWGIAKRQFIKLGAKDAYFGYPDRLYVKPEKPPTEGYEQL